MKLRMRPLLLSGIFIALTAFGIMLGSSGRSPVIGSVRAESGVTPSRIAELASLDPHDRLRGAVAAYYDGHFDTAIGVLEQLVADDPGGREDDGIVRRATMSLLALYRESGQYEKALNLLSREEYVDDSAPLTGWAVEISYLAGRPEEALEHFSVLTEDERHIIEPRLRLFAARAHFALGERGAALELLRNILDTTRHMPEAYRLLGELHAAEGRHRAAVAAFRSARSQEPNLTATLLPEARSRLELGQPEQARSLLVQAERARPHDDNVSELLARVEEEYPAIVETEREEDERRRELTAAPLVEYHPEDREGIERIRVGLAESLGELHLKSSSDWEIELLDSRRRSARAGGEPIARGRAEQLLRIDWIDDSIVLSVDGERILTHRLADGWIRMRNLDEDGTFILFDMEHSRGQFSAGSEDRAYRGALRFGPSTAEGFTVVNELDLESYLYSVVPSEMPASWPHAALEAQAIAARSYTIANLGRFSSRGFDLLGSVRSAFYRGYSGESPRTTRAVDATRGLVLTVNGTTVPAYYSANNAGHSDRAADVWGGTVVGMSSVADPQLDWDGRPRRPDELLEWLTDYPDSYSAAFPFASRNAYRWELWVEAEELVARLGDGVGEIHSLRTSGRTPAGRVTAVTIEGSAGTRTVTGDAIRQRIGGIRSNLFVVEPVFTPAGSDNGEEAGAGTAGDGAGIAGPLPEEQPRPRAFVLRGGGWGHGVGMDQTGAAGMASVGARAEAILNHYFPDAEITEAY